MSTIVTRAGKGSALTFAEVDSNFTNLNTDKYQSGSAASLASLTLTAPLLVSFGGTGITSYASGDLLAADTTTTLTKIPAPAYGFVLASSSFGAPPNYQKVHLINHVTSVLRVANGGTGAASLTGVLKGNGGTNPISAATAGTDYLIPNVQTVGIIICQPSDPFSGSLKITSSSTDPLLPGNGEIWNIGGTLKFNNGSATRTFAFDDSNITGNASTATTLQTARNINGVSFNGSADITVSANTTTAVTFAATGGAAAGTTFDGSSARTIDYGTVGASPLAGSASIATVGTVTTGTWSATAIAANRGGTGQTTYAVGDLLYADTASTIAKLADVATGNALISGGVGVAPSYGKIGLTTHVSGTLPVANGGTGITSLGTGIATFLGTPSSANLLAAMSDETGTGLLVFGTSPTIATPTITTSATAPLLIGGTTTTSTLRLRSTSGVGAAGADIIFQVGSNGATEAMRVLNSGNVGIGTATPAQKLDVAGVVAADGIQFPAVQVASADVHTLDDYDEGTWTATIIGTTTAGAGTYTTQVARYTKIGRVVHVNCRLIWTAHTGAGNMQIRGLPFACETAAASWFGVNFGVVSNIALTAGYVMTGYVQNNTSVINLQQYPTGGGASIAVPLDTAGTLVVSATYQAAT